MIINQLRKIKIITEYRVKELKRDNWAMIVMRYMKVVKMIKVLRMIKVLKMIMFIVIKKIKLRVKFEQTRH